MARMVRKRYGTVTVNQFFTNFRKILVHGFLFFLLWGKRVPFMYPFSTPTIPQCRILVTRVYLNAYFSRSSVPIRHSHTLPPFGITKQPFVFCFCSNLCLDIPLILVLSSHLVGIHRPILYLHHPQVGKPSAIPFLTINFELN